MRDGGEHELVARERCIFFRVGRELVGWGWNPWTMASCTGDVRNGGCQQYEVVLWGNGGLGMSRIVAMGNHN